MSLRIAQVGPLWENIPPPFYGGTERIVSSLTEGLMKKGHDVTLFACGTSKTSAKLISTYPRPLFRDGIPWTNIMYPLLHITKVLEMEKQFDVIHMHLNKASDYLALPLFEPIKHKVVVMMHFAAPQYKNYPDRQLVLEKYHGMNYVSISNFQRVGMEKLNWIATVYNGIDIENYTFNSYPKDYFLWLGKFNADKGTKEAILAAKKAGIKLLLGGAIDKLDGDDYRYYTEEVKPLIDGKQIIFIGEVGGKEKDELLGNAVGFLNPIQWNEPFGLVSPEAMATGTPVISFRRGALPEIIQDGVNGFLVDNVDQMVEKIKDIHTIERIKCRERIEEKFTSQIMVDEYEKVYLNLLNR
jgi:glycosyltransferase involved in cell wall biosynthesis